MRWTARNNDGWRRAFAFLPLKIGDQMIWLEPYWRRWWGDHFEVALERPAPLSKWDVFQGDNDRLRASIAALLEMDAEGALAPHGLGGHARTLLTAAYARLPARGER